MGSFPFVIIFLGFLTLAGLVFWIRQREQSETRFDLHGMADGMSNMNGHHAGVIVASGHGQLLHVNPLVCNWMSLNGDEPDLEDIIAATQPSDNFVQLLTSEAQASFQLGNRWVEGTSHLVPGTQGERMMVVLRELNAQSASAVSKTRVMDVSRAMSIINEIGETVTASMGVELALQVLLEILNKVLSSDAGEICIWDDEHNYLNQRGWIGDTRYLLTVASRGGGYDPGVGVAGWVAQYRRPVLVSGDKDTVNNAVMLKDNPYRSAIGVPLILGDNLVGTLTMFCEAAARYSAEDLSLLQAVSGAVATSIRNAQLYATQEERINDIASLQQIAEHPKGEGDVAPIYKVLNERMANLLDADMCGVFIYEAERTALIPQMPFYGLPEHVADKIIIPLTPGSVQHNIWMQQPYWVSNDVADEPLVEDLNMKPIVDVAGIRNTALFPLQIAGERIGIMAISNKRSPGGFTPNDLQNLRVLASQAAIVVENMRLYQRERRIDTELVGLQEMTHAIGALDHEGEFYSVISERIARLMGCEMCGVLLYDRNRSRLISQLPFYGVPDELMADYSINLPSGSVMEQLWQEEDYWFSNRVMTDPLVFEADLDKLAETVNISKTLFAAMSVGGRRTGVVQVSNKLDSSDFDERDAQLLQIFATQAAAIIENARLYQEIRYRADQAESLRRVAELSSTVMTTEETFKPVLREIAHLTDSEIVFINIVDHNTHTLITYPRWVYGIDMDETIIQDLGATGYENTPARSGEYFISNNVSNDNRLLPSYRRLSQRYGIQSTVLVPLAVGDHVLGELGVGNRRSGLYTRDDIATFSTVAAQIASSVERLLLYEATGENLSRRVEELDAIARVSNELTLTVELDKILEIIREEAVKAAHADDGTIVMLRPQAEWVMVDKPEIENRIGNLALPLILAPIEREAILRGADSVVVDNYATHDLKPMPDDVRSAAAVAILHQDQVIGVIHVVDREVNAFDDRAAGFLLTLSTKAALAYQNALLYRQQMERGERLRQRVDQLNRIFELGQMVQSTTDPVMVLEAIAYSIQQSVGFDTVLMLLRDENSDEMRRVAHAGMPLDAFEESKGITLSYNQLQDLLQEDYRISESYFFPIEQADGWHAPGINALSAHYPSNRSLAPRGKDWWHDGDLLLVRINGQGGDMLGMISLDRPYNNKRLTRADIEVLEIFAHQASTMIENTRLFRDSQRSAEQEAHLNDMLEQIAGTLDLSEIAETIAVGLLEVLAFDRMTLALQNEQDEAFDYLAVNVRENGLLDVRKEQRQTLERTALGRVYEDREEFACSCDDRIAQHYDDVRTWHNEGEQSTLILPLVAGGISLGALHLGSNALGNLDSLEIRQLLRRMVRLVASTVQNARLFNQAVTLQILNRSVVESIQQGIVVLDESGKIISINEFMRQSYQWDDSARHRDLFDYRTEFSEFLKDDLRLVLEDGIPRERIGQTTPAEANEMVVRNFYMYPLRSRDEVCGAVLLVEDVTERAKLEEAIETRANQLAALTEVSNRITSSLERDEVIAVALDEMGWIVPFKTMSIWRRNGAFMVLEGAAGFEDPVPQERMRIRIADDERIRQLVESQRVVSLTADEELSGYSLLGDDGIRSWMGVPLVNQGHVVGMLILTKEEAGTFETRQEQHVAFAFASQVAIALANADLFEQTFERTNELGTLLEAAQATSLTRNLGEVFRTVAELMFSALEMEDCTIMIWDEVDNELEVQYSGNRMGDESRILEFGSRYAVSEYPAREHALRERQVVVIVDKENGNGTTGAPLYPFELAEMRHLNQGARMIVPLVVRDQSIGLIQLEQRSREEESFTQQKVRLARALGSQVAVAIENGRLQAETTSRFEELLTINQLSQSISSTLKLEAMLPIIRDQVPQVTSAEEMYLALYDAERERITFPLAVRSSGETFVIPERPLVNDEVSYIIKRRHSLSLGADYFSIDELRRSMNITNGEGDIKAYMGVPLKSGAQVLGVLAIRNIHIHRTFTLNDDRILTTVGSQLGAAIQNARLFEQLEDAKNNLEDQIEDRTQQLAEERDRLDKLYQITLELSRTLDMEHLLDRSLNLLSDAVGADDGVIMLNDLATDNLYSRVWIDPNNLIPTADSAVMTHPAVGLATWLIHNDEISEGIVVVDDLDQHAYWDAHGRRTGLRSAMAVLLENNDDPMGVMVLLARQPAAFAENHLKLLLPAVNQVAASINIAELYQLIRDQAERMGKLMRTEREERQKNSAILESIADGVLLANAKGEIVLFNTAAERILELSRDHAVGEPVSKLAGLHGRSGTRWMDLVSAWSEHDDDPNMMNEPITQRLEVGNKIISTQLSPVYIGDVFLGTVSVFRDVTKDVEADRAKSQFIANVSHEFRTPLTPIKGYTDLLLMNAGGTLNDMQLQMVQTIKDNVDRLAVLVDDVLNISKLDSGEDELHLSTIDLADLLPAVFSRIANRQLNREKAIESLIEVADDVPHITADREKVSQILGNVIDNAFNYTPAGGTIGVSVVRDQNSASVIITVADSGVGIPEEFREAAWRRFERFDQHAVEMDVAGTGLGLSLTRDLVKLHAGDIWFESKVGTGTTFYIRLPIAQPKFRTTREIPQINTGTLAGD